jgi:hypothetical protein
MNHSMIANIMEETVGMDDYDTLPVSIRALYTKQEWLWLPDSSKATLEQRECEPDWEE